MAQRHLVAVWNPSYETDAMDQHLSVLLANAARFRDARFVEVGSKTMDLMTSPPLSLGQLALAIGDNKALNDWLKRRLEPRDWVSISLPPVLENLASEVADGPQSVIQRQVANGVAVRMAVLATIVRNVQARRHFQ